MKDEQITRIESELSTLFRRAKAHMRDAAASFNPPLQTSTYSLLSYLVKKGPARAQELVDVFDTDKATVSRHLRTLTDMNLLVRLPDPTDGRAYLLSVTEEASEQWSRSFERSQAAIRSLLKTWSEKDGERFTELLERFNSQA